MGRLTTKARSIGSAITARLGPSEVDRLAQIYAGIMLIVFVPLSIVVAGVINEIFLDWMPDAVAAIAALRVIIGALLVIVTGMSWILFVRTGGFGLFA